MPQASGTRAAKMECFESIRGLAALAVFVGHMILGFWPVLYFRNGPRWEEIPAGLQVVARFGKFLWNGELAVTIFFVLSGFVLSLAFFQRRSGAGLSSAAIRRLPRLMLPVAGSILLALLLLQAGLMFSPQAASRMDELQGLKAQPGAATDESNEWLRYFYNFTPDVTT